MNVREGCFFVFFFHYLLNCLCLNASEPAQFCGVLDLHVYLSMRAARETPGKPIKTQLIYIAYLTL